MIGLFGWLDTPSPALTYLLWTVAIGFLFLLAVMVAKRRHVLLILGLVIATIVVPVVLEFPAYRDVGSVFWQGRYTLPLAVGIPIVAAMSIACTEIGRRLYKLRLHWIIGGIVAVGSTLAFAQNLRRYTVGYNGDVWYWLRPQWSPPASPLLLTVVYVIAVVAFVGWVLAFCQAPDRGPGEVHAEVGVPVAANRNSRPDAHCWDFAILRQHVARSTPGSRRAGGWTVIDVEDRAEIRRLHRATGSNREAAHRRAWPSKRNPYGRQPAYDQS